MMGVRLIFTVTLLTTLRDKFINPLLSESISSKSIKQHANWSASAEAAAAESETRPTYKLKLIKTINNLMLFRFVFGLVVLCTQ